MVQAWYMDTSSKNLDQREEHKYSPNRPVTLEELKKKTGVEYFTFFPKSGKGEKYVEDPKLTQLKKERGYTYEDDITITKEKLPNYEEKIKMFFEEHLHADEEIRYCMEGSGYFDVRDENNDWIRIELGVGDMIILPAGMYHRFTLDTKNFIRAKRFFVGEPVWTPHNWPAEDHPARVSYLTNRKEVGLSS